MSIMLSRAIGALPRPGCWRSCCAADRHLVEYYVYPNPGAWAAAGRWVICEIRGTHGKLTGSVRAPAG
jgi:hypothetical protein